jgi:hypothetical protein
MTVTVWLAVYLVTMAFAIACGTLLLIVLLFHDRKG